MKTAAEKEIQGNEGLVSMGMHRDRYRVHLGSGIELVPSVYLSSELILIAMQTVDGPGVL